MDVPKIPTIRECDSKNREKETIVSDLDGTLLNGRSSFPYFAMIAFDVGGILRLLLPLLVSPIVALLYYVVSESAGIKLLIFTTFAGVKVSSIKSAASAVLPKHYSEDLHPNTWRVFSSCGRKCMLTANPRVVVEPFLKYLGVDDVAGADGVLVGKNKATALRRAFVNEEMPDIGVGDRKTDYPFMRRCKERYIVPQRTRCRLVQKPSPLMALVIILWFPIGLVLSILRILIAATFPISSICHIVNLFGCPTSIKGAPPVELVSGTTVRGYKWLDPLFIYMNPRPAYEVTFLNKLSPDQTCKFGKSSHQVANNVQDMIAKTLGFKCTKLTRKDKYRALAGTDGLVAKKLTQGECELIYQPTNDPIANLLFQILCFIWILYFNFRVSFRILISLIYITS